MHICVHLKNSYSQQLLEFQTKYRHRAPSVRLRFCLLWPNCWANRLKFGCKVSLLTGNRDCKANSGHVTLSRPKWQTTQGWAVTMLFLLLHCQTLELFTFSHLPQHLMTLPLFKKQIFLPPNKLQDYCLFPYYSINAVLLFKAWPR